MPVHLLELPSLSIKTKADIATRLTSHFKNLIDSWSYEHLTQSDVDTEKEFHTFLHSNSAYGILSHRWLSKGEPTFMDMPSLHSGPGIFRSMLKGKKGIEAWDGQTKSNPGFDKIINFCKIASKYECKYVWFDTGCINKASSAELEESIRSMFNWYRNSKICIVHLAQTTNALDLRKDPWFTRGWTLQELLAPRIIKFYDKSWCPLTSVANDKVHDTKLGHPLWGIIEEITSIPQKDLLSFEPGIQNVRQRLTWVSKRTTTRIEDMAYCLIGIFNIPLSVAYGEGDMAFYRLQLEIMQRTNDQALFAWNGLSSVHNSMFAAAPDCFAAPLILQATQSDPDYALTNRGLRISLPIFNVTVKPGAEADTYVLEEQGPTTDATITPELQTKFRCTKAVLLGNLQDTTPFVILLEFDEMKKRYKRVAAGKVLICKPPKKLSLEPMFII